MEFTQPCFIRKNTKEIREYLISIGYDTAQCEDIDAYGECLIVSNGDTNSRCDYPNYSVCDNYFLDRFFSNREDIIDCGDNEELFKALASLQDTTDINQWYTDGNVWHLCNFRDISTEFCRGDTPFRNQKFHKATVEELINHFQ